MFYPSSPLIESQFWVLVTAVVLDQPCLDSLVGRTANPLPVFVEVGVLRVLPRSAVVSFMVALTTTIAVIPHCRTERNHSWCLVTLALLVVFLVPGGARKVLFYRFSSPSGSFAATCGSVSRK
jgi:hypothetical protein